MFIKIKNLCYSLILYSRIIFVLRFIYRKVFNNPIKILYTHRIIDKSHDIFGFLHELDYFDEAEFEKKVKYLVEYYKIISLEQCVEYLKKKKRPPNCVVLNIDDGYKCAYTKAFPIFKKYNIPATVFLAIEFIEKRSISWFDKLILMIGKTRLKEVKIPAISNEIFKLETLIDRKKLFLKANKFLKTLLDTKKEEILQEIQKVLDVSDENIQEKDLMLSWGEIKEMSDSGLVSFGAHTVLHPVLTRITMERVEYELLRSKQVIEEKLNKQVKFFSYPAGFFNSAIKKKVKACSYAAAFTTKSGGNNEQSDLFALNRDGFIRGHQGIFGLQIGGVFDLFKAKIHLNRISKHKVFANLADKGLQYWLPGYIIEKCGSRRKCNRKLPVHIMLCIVDHFEPFHGAVPFEQAKIRMDKWKNEYPMFCQKYIDADGRMPQHTWFYPPHLDHCFLKDLVCLCKQGYGEIEMHLHHNHMEPFPDTSETLKAKILKCIEDYSKYGIFCLPDGSKRFGFVHGDWSLDNSLGDDFCGVNNEIEILKECGCYADFTFPSLGSAQPAMVNKIYYVKDNPKRSKSYNWGKELKVKGEPWGDLLMIPGIIGLRWNSRMHRMLPSIESSDISRANFHAEKRIDYWIKNAIVIKGICNWKFIKLHTHGAIEDTVDSLHGKNATLMHQYLKDKYNDGKRYVLHYVTAREMYNIIKAAEDGKEGNPNCYRDYRIPMYSYKAPK